jgi:hypothetical protein
VLRGDLSFVRLAASGRVTSGNFSRGSSNRNHSDLPAISSSLHLLNHLRPNNSSDSLQKSRLRFPLSRSMEIRNHSNPRTQTWRKRCQFWQRHFDRRWHFRERAPGDTHNFFPLRSSRLVNALSSDRETSWTKPRRISVTRSHGKESLSLSCKRHPKPLSPATSPAGRQMTPYAISRSSTPSKVAKGNGLCIYFGF